MPSYTHSMIFLHGFTMEPKDMEYFTDKIDRILPKGVKMKYIFPKAPEREISCYGGESYSAWYDYLTENITELEEVNQSHIIKQRNRIHRLIQKEKKTVGKFNHIFLAGYSQGCCMALDAGITFPYKLGGIIGFKGHIPEMFDKTYDQHIWVTHGRYDDTIDFEVARNSYENFPNYDITFIKQQCDHEMETGIEYQMRMLKQWMKDMYL